MDRKFQIGEIAGFFDIPASTLRYWEDKGVLHPGKKAENQYREYTIEDLMTISDVIFYKNLGLQLKEICGMEASTPKQHQELFAEKIVELKRQQEMLTRRMEKLRYHMQAVEMLETLKAQPYQETDIDTDCVVSFDLIEIDKLRRYIENPYLYTRIQHSQSLPQEQRGITVSADMSSSFPESSILWQKQSARHITFLMKEEVTTGFPNDLPEHLARIQETYRTGAIISRFLLCAQENGKTYDFYKTFVEILPDSVNK